MNKITVFLFGATWKKITAAVLGGLAVGVGVSRYVIWRNPILVGKLVLADLTPEQKKAHMAKVKADLAAHKAKKEAKPAQQAPAQA